LPPGEAHEIAFVAARSETAVDPEHLAFSADLAETGRQRLGREPGPLFLPEPSPAVDTERSTSSNPRSGRNF